MSTQKPGARVGQSYVMVNDLYTFRATSAETGGAYMIMDAVVPPGGGPPMHIHTREVEVFVVVHGSIACTEDGVTRTLGPGDSITLRPHKPHTFRNLTQEPARMLVIALPAGIERMFAETGTPVPSSHTLGPARPPTREELESLTASCADAGISFA